MKGAVVILCALAASLALTHGALAEVYIYPDRGQSAERQSRDRYECHQWAASQTGFDPATAQASPPSAPTTGPLRGAGRGAAVGALGGAIGGNAGAGAAAGAAAGALFGGMRRAGQEQAAAQQQATTNQANAQFERALAACLSGRGYTVR
jgi:OmpA family protein